MLGSTLEMQRRAMSTLLPSKVALFPSLCVGQRVREECVCGQQPPVSNEERFRCWGVMPWIYPFTHVCGFDSLLFRQRQDASLFFVFFVFFFKFIYYEIESA